MILNTPYRSSRRRCSVKKVFLEILQNSQENTCARASILIKFQAFIKIETLAQVFSCEFCEISKTTFSYRAPPVAASHHSKKLRTSAMAWNEQVYFALKIISTITLLIYATIYARLNLQNKFHFLHICKCGHVISVSNLCYSKRLL